MFVTALFVICKTWKQPKWPIEKWLKYCSVLIQWNTYYSLAKRRYELLYSTTEMKLKNITLNEKLSQKQKGTHCIITLKQSSMISIFNPHDRNQNNGCSWAGAVVRDGPCRTVFILMHVNN